MKRILILALLIPVLFLFGGCATMGPEMIKIDKEIHENILKVAETRMEYVSCDLGLIDGLGVASVAAFPIKNGQEARAILNNPAIGITLGEMRQITEGAGKWKQKDFDECKVLGLGYRATALGTIDILKLFPQLTPYLAIFAQ